MYIFGFARSIYLSASRYVSGDHIVLSSYREQSHCMIMGEAAGIAAAQAVVCDLLEIQKQLNLESS